MIRTILKDQDHNEIIQLATSNDYRMRFGASLMLGMVSKMKLQIGGDKF